MSDPDEDKYRERVMVTRICRWCVHRQPDKTCKLTGEPTFEDEHCEDFDDGN